MSIGPIPWSSLLAYADREGYNEDETERFVEIIRSLDDEYLRLIHERSTKKPTKGGKDKGEPVREVSPVDTEGTRDIFRNLMLKQSASKPRLKRKVAIVK